MSGHEPLVGVGKTALGVALVRARESRRPDRLFDDPYAAAFVTASPGAFAQVSTTTGEPGEPEAGVGAAFAFHAVLRTRFFDDCLLQACREGIRQVVLLAAGFDTRAFRLSWPAGVRLFELELPDVLAFKEPILRQQHAREGCHRLALPVDLRGDWPSAVRRAGLDPQAPTAWLAEGLMIYLSATEAEQLLSSIGRLSAAGSRVAFEHGSALDAATAARAAATPGMADYASLWKGGLGQDTAHWLTEHGWSVRMHDRAALAGSYGRALPGSSAGAFLTAIRGQQHNVATHDDL